MSSISLRESNAATTLSSIMSTLAELLISAKHKAAYGEVGSLYSNHLSLIHSISTSNMGKL